MRTSYVISGSIFVRFKVNGVSQATKREKFPTLVKFAEREVTASGVPKNLIIVFNTQLV